MRTIIISIFIAICLILIGCGSGGERGLHEHSHDHSHMEGEHDHSDEIHFSKEQAEVVGLILETVEPGLFRQVIKTSGEIKSSQGDEATIVSTASGIVAFANAPVTQGMSVRSGEMVASVSAQKLPEGDPVVKARIAYETAKSEFERAESLVADQIISEKEFEQARYRYETAKTVYEAQSYNYNKGSIGVNSPINGFIKNVFVNQGDFVSVGQPIATVSQNRKLQLQAEVAERYFSSIKNVSGANFKMAYDEKLYELEKLNGKLVSFGRSTDDGSFFIPVIFEFDNIGEIIPGSFTEVYLLSLPLENVISVPVSAITEEQGLYFVYTQLHDEHYKKQEVSIGNSDGLRVEILSGLNEGDRVVTKGAVQVKMAAVSSVIPEGHSH